MKTGIKSYNNDETIAPRDFVRLVEDSDIAFPSSLSDDETRTFVRELGKIAQETQ